MAYKNKKHNKRHIAELRKSGEGWRKHKRQQKRLKKARNTPDLTLEELEEMVKKLG